MSNTKDIEIDFITTNIKGQNKKAVFENILSYIGEKMSVEANAPLERLIEKENFECSTIGNGVAVPHVRVDSLDYPVTVLARLEKPADFNAQDKTKVDLVCMVLSPKSSGAFRLMRVSRIQRMLSDKELCNAIRSADSADEVHNIIFNPEGWVMAA